MLTHSDIKVRTFTGSQVKTYLPSIARLRIEVFRDFPYLYEGNLDNEMQYLKKYASCKESIVVIIFDGSEIVGASTGIPLDFESASVKKPFAQNGMDTSQYFYFSESLLLKRYRGRGIGHHFFDLREAHVQQLKKYKYICFRCIARLQEHPQKPDDYIPLDDFWKKRGYVQHPEMEYSVSWPDIGEKEESEKPMAFWIKPIKKQGQKTP
jgi:GNAT superfamily N-acetyltransferase